MFVHHIRACSGTTCTSFCTRYITCETTATSDFISVSNPSRPCCVKNFCHLFQSINYVYNIISDVTKLLDINYRMPERWNLTNTITQITSYSAYNFKHLPHKWYFTPLFLVRKVLELNPVFYSNPVSSGIYDIIDTGTSTRLSDSVVVDSRNPDLSPLM